MSDEPIDTSVTYQDIEITWFIHRGHVIYKDEESEHWFIQGREHLVYLHQDGPISAIDFEYRLLKQEVCRIENERTSG